MNGSRTDAANDYSASASLGCTISLLDSSRPSGSALVIFFFAYMLAAAFGRWMMVIPGIPITLWPPNGLVLAMLLTRPPRTWMWWLAGGAAGELTGNVLWFHNPLLWASGYIAANTTAVLTSALLLAPILRMPIRRFSTLSQIAAFLAIAVVGAPVISATIGSLIDAIVGKNPFMITWPIWWLGDATGILIATPLVVSLVNAWQDKAWPSMLQVFEGLAIALILAGLSVWELTRGAGYAFLLPLPILWAALRYEFRGTTLAVLMLALLISIHAQNIGSDDAADVALTHARMQALLLVSASTGLVAAAIIRQQREALFRLAEANDELEDRVAERTRAIEAAEQRFRATFQNAGVGIGIVSDDGRLMQVNDRMMAMLGYEPDEIVNRSLDEFTHPDDRASGEAALEMLRQGKADEYDLEKRYLRKDGDILWGHTTVSCVRHSGGRIAYLIKIIQDITARKRAEEARQLLMREVNHRSKNLLTIVQVIARQTAMRSPGEFAKSFGSRLRALASNQDLLVNSEWQPIALSDLVRSQVEHFAEVGGRVQMDGPFLKVSPSAAQALGMALHELATNAAKYGGLSNDTGRVVITWAVEEQAFRMVWREIGGPEVTAPEARGFGSTVLESMTATSLSGNVKVEYAREGVLWQLVCPLTAILDSREN